MKKNLLFTSLLSFLPLVVMANDNTTSKLISELTPYLNKVENCIAYYSNMDKKNQIVDTLALVPDNLGLIGGNCSSGHKTSVFDPNISWDIPGQDVTSSNIIQFFVVENGLVRITIPFNEKGSDLYLVPYFKETGTYKVEWLIGESSPCIKDKSCSGKTDSEYRKTAIYKAKEHYDNLLKKLNEQESKLYYKTVINEKLLQKEWEDWSYSHLMNINVNELEKEFTKHSPDFSKHLFVYKALANDIEQRITAIKPLSSNSLSAILYQGIYQYEKLADRLDYDIPNSIGMLRYKGAVNNIFNRDGTKRNIDSKFYYKYLEVMFYSAKAEATNIFTHQKIIDEAQKFMFEANNLLNFFSDEKLKNYRIEEKIDDSVTDQDLIKQINEKLAIARKENISDEDLYKHFIQHTENYMAMLEMLYADKDKALYLQPQINYVIDICNNDSSCYIKYNQEVLERLSSLKTDMINSFGSRFAENLNAYEEKWQNFKKKIAITRAHKGINLFVHELTSNIIEYNLLLGTMMNIESSDKELIKKYSNLKNRY